MLWMRVADVVSVCAEGVVRKRVCAVCDHFASLHVVCMLRVR